MNSEITQQQIATRKKWVQALGESSETFSETSQRTFEALKAEVDSGGYEHLLSHLRFCGTIPERYRHDSSEEKAYSKYTDAVIAESLVFLGLKATVLDGRSDMADVEAVANNFDLVADAKAFRMTRTAKNQKDFKVAAMDRWRYDKKFSVVVCPVDHLPARSSQIYLDASSRNVCILSYSHVAVLVRACVSLGQETAVKLLHNLLAEPGLMNPSKDAQAYWRAINLRIVSADENIADLWRAEKQANQDAMTILKQEGLQFYSEERSKILGLSHQEALDQLMATYRIDEKISAIEKFAASGLLDMQS